MNITNRRFIAFFVLICGLLSCKLSVHDAAMEMANKKCSLYFANKEYEQVHNEYMMFMSQRKMGINDTSRAGMNNDRFVQLQKNLTERQEKIAEELQDLNDDIILLDKKYYNQYDDKELASIHRDVKALVDKCTHN